MRNAVENEEEAEKAAVEGGEIYCVSLCFYVYTRK